MDLITWNAIFPTNITYASQIGLGLKHHYLSTYFCCDVRYQKGDICQFCFIFITNKQTNKLSYIYL